jgi:cytoskeletal protein CcmA (bactofilin family)
MKSTDGKSWEDVRISLGPDAEVAGKLSFAVPTRIEGKLKGEVRAWDMLVVGPRAVVHATVWAERLVVLGEVHGSVHSARIDIGAGGRLQGDIETGCLVIEEGGRFEGRSRMVNEGELVAKATDRA